MKKPIQHISEQQIAEALTNTFFFSGLDAHSINHLSKQFTPHYIESESVLMNEGDEGDSIYLVMNGRLRVIKNYNKDTQEILREIGSGELIGELALLTGENRAATIIAMRDSVLLRLSKSAFLKFIELNPLQLLKIAKHSILRLINPKKPQKNNLATLVIIPAGNDTSSYHDFSLKLSAELAKVEPTLYLSQTNLPSQLKDNEFLMAKWLNEQEVNYRYIVYETDPTYTAWTKLCIRQADQILSVSSASADPACNSIEKEIYSQSESTLKAVELVLIHPDTTVTPTNTARWLDLRRAKLNHHIKQNTPDGYSRLVRYLTGQSIALVYSGGAGRGVAHIGVYRALEECGIPIDMVAGVSAGSIMAAFVAQQKSWEEMIEISKISLTKSENLFDYTFPFVSLLAGKSWYTILYRLFGETCIEDLWIPFFCVSTNITQSRAEIHRRGVLWKAIRASLSLPAILPPVSTDEGDVLVDGGIVNNLPVDIMQKFMKGGKVIAVSVSIMSKMNSWKLGDGVFSGWKSLLQRFSWSKQQEKGMPVISDIILTTIGIAGHQHQVLMAQRADLFLQLHVEQYGMFDFSAIDVLVETGYKDSLPLIKENLCSNSQQPSS